MAPLLVPLLSGWVQASRRRHRGQFSLHLSSCPTHPMPLRCCCADGKGEVWRQQAQPVARLVDTTGAGGALKLSSCCFFLCHPTAAPLTPTCLPLLSTLPACRRLLHRGLCCGPAAGGAQPSGGDALCQLCSRAVHPGGGRHAQHAQQAAGGGGPGGRLPQLGLLALPCLLVTLNFESGPSLTVHFVDLSSCIAT